jgi:uncharacterized protein (TIGR01777 family)
MKIIITGGSGLIGQALTKEFINDGHEVVILSRNPEQASRLLSDATEVYWDGKTQGDWVSHVNGADAIINLAGESIAGKNLLNMRWTRKRKVQIRESRVNAGKVLVEAIGTVEDKPSLFIQSSAVGIYGPLADQIVDENYPRANDYLAKVCIDWEKSTEEVEALGVRRIILRTGLVFSKDGGIFSLLKLPFSLFVGGILGTGKQYLSWIHIDDVVGGIKYLIEDQNAVGIFNLTAPIPVTNKEFSKRLGKAMNRPSLIPLPSFVMRLALGEVSILALEGQRVVPSHLLDRGYQFKYNKLDDALVDLLQPTHHYQHSFMVKATKDKVASFHQNTKVLKNLTPFPIIVQFKQVEPVGEGTRTIFTLWFGPIPVKWEAVHHDFNLPDGFSDTQTEGPFVSWHHRHTFKEMDENHTMVIDDINAVFGKGLFAGIISRFMWVTLPILFAYRAWKTRRSIEKTLTQENG